MKKILFITSAAIFLSLSPAQAEVCELDTIYTEGEISRTYNEGRDSAMHFLDFFIEECQNKYKVNDDKKDARDLYCFCFSKCKTKTTNAGEGYPDEITFEEYGSADGLKAAENRQNKKCEEECAGLYKRLK